MKKRVLLVLLILLMGLGSVQVARANLAAVGPVGANLFPEWYQDFTGMTLGVCLDGDGLTGPCIFDPVNTLNPTSVLAGFGTEDMYWYAQADLTFSNGGRALLVLALEAAFNTLTGEAAPGQQIVFQRVRLRLDAPVPGTYTVTHPYGTDVFPSVAAGRRTINHTVDIMGLSGDFITPLSGPIGPNFLVWTAPDFPYVDPVFPGNQYVGNPLVPHTVTGSPTGNNIFRIEAVDPLGNPIDLNGPAPGLALETDLFLVSGKIVNVGAPPPPPPPNVPTPLTIDRVTSTAIAGVTQVDIFVTSADNATVTVLAGLGPQPLQANPTVPGSFFGRVTAPDGPITLTAVAAPLAPTTLTVPVAAITDVVTIKAATFNLKRGILNVTAVSNSRQLGVIPQLTVFDEAGNELGPIVRGSLVRRDLTVPPRSVTVRSSLGGASTLQTRIR